MDYIDFKSLLRKHDVQVISITEPFEDTPTGRLLEAIIESLDEFYSANLGQEVLRGLQESASRGFYVSSRTPYGYKRVKVKDGSRERPTLEVIPEQAAVVSRIFRESLSGLGLKEIARGLNSDGIAAPRGKRWSKTSLHQILTNEVHTGPLVWGRRSNYPDKVSPIRVENAWEPIIEKEIFHKVQAVLKEKSPHNIHPRRAASPYLLSGIARCGHCGRALVCQEAKSGKYSYYQCGTLLKHGAGSCQARYLNSKKFEKLIIDKIKERILTEDNLQELVQLVNEEMDATLSETRQRLDTVTAEVEDIHKRLGRLYDALETGKLTINDLSPRIQELRHREDQLQAARLDLEGSLSQRQVRLTDPEIVKGYVENLQQVLSGSQLLEQKAFIRSFVKEVRVTGDEVVLTYTMPLTPEGINQDKERVLDTVQYGGRYWT